MNSTQKRLDPFYPIVDSCDWLQRLLPLGIKLVQLRIKDRSDDDLRVEIARARDLCAAQQCQLIVNDYWRLAIELGCDYVHLGQEDLDRADIDTIKGHGLRLGVSTHSDEELARALALEPDYVALGPIYPTILKKMPWAPQGLERVSEWKSRIGAIPLVGIGGINPERAEGVLAAGADVVSVVTDITLNQDPEARTSLWVGLTAKYRLQDPD